MNAWGYVALLAIGFAGGLFVGAKFINTPGDKYSFGKLKVKGKGNQVESLQVAQPQTQKEGFLKRKRREKTRSKKTRRRSN